jgi:hypothetical protein
MPDARCTRGPVCKMGEGNAQDRYEPSAAVPVDSLPDVLPEAVFSILSPLYELFDFFKLPKRLVEEELREMSRNTFAH